MTCEGCARLTEEQVNNLDRGADGEALPGQKAYLVPGHLYRAMHTSTVPPPASD